MMNILITAIKEAFVMFANVAVSFGTIVTLAVLLLKLKNCVDED